MQDDNFEDCRKFLKDIGMTTLEIWYGPRKQVKPGMVVEYDEGRFRTLEMSEGHLKEHDVPIDEAKPLSSDVKEMFGWAEGRRRNGFYVAIGVEFKVVYDMATFDNKDLLRMWDVAGKHGINFSPPIHDGIVEATKMYCRRCTAEECSCYGGKREMMVMLKSKHATAETSEAA